MYRVLFADDEPIMRIAFRKMMEEGSARFALAAVVANGAEALHYIGENPVDIVVTDLKMPVMDGLALIEALKASGFAGAILVLSNYNDFELVRTALTRGASDYVLKQSIDAEKLLRQLNTMAQSIAAQAAGDRNPALPRANTSPKELRGLYEGGGTFRPCLLSVRQNGAQSALDSLERVIAVLEQVLGDSSALISGIAEDKALLLLPHELPRAEDKLRQAVRGIRTYLNLSADVLIAPPASSPEQAQQYCAECVRASDPPPSPEEPPVRAMEEVLFAHLPQFKRYKKEVCDALLFIHFHFAEKISLDDVAKAVSLNRDYLCRLFRQETGEPMFRYINDLRMQKAARLIGEGYTYMRGVAADVGIDDQFYFARVFKKYHGVPPSEYGKRRRN